MRCDASKVTRDKNFGNMAQAKLNKMIQEDEDSCTSTTVGLAIAFQPLSLEDGGLDLGFIPMYLI